MNAGMQEFKLDQKVVFAWCIGVAILEGAGEGGALNFAHLKQRQK